MSDKYKRVSCDFYDQLEISAMHDKELSMTYLNADAEKITSIITIKTLETKNKEEFLITISGLRIRLDQIVALTEV